jgi:hypothetical protein
MPCNIQAVPGTNTIYATFSGSLPRWMAEHSELWDGRYQIQSRSIKSCDFSWTTTCGLWPTRRGMGFYQDPASYHSPFSSVDAFGKQGDFQAIAAGYPGSQSLKFIRGRCKDSNGDGVSGATVQGFVTGTDAFVRETTAESSG